MDFQAIVDSVAAIACILSVEKCEENYGEIRIVAGNKLYINSIEQQASGFEKSDRAFIPNSLYTDYLPPDLNFENYCYRCAIQGETLHSYVHPNRTSNWFNLTFLPIKSDNESIFYCMYTMEIEPNVNTEKISGVSGDLASRVLETSIKFYENRDFHSTMDEVIIDIREFCEAEYACILLMDHEERTCSVLCEDIAEGSPLSSMEVYVKGNFYKVAERWESTIGGSNCLIAKNDYDMNIIKEKNPGWHKSLVSVNASSVILFPLKSRNGLLGYIWALNFNPDNSIKIKETFELTTYILSSEITSYMLLNRLKILSSHDMLTGALNRNEMNIVVEDLSEGNYGKDKSIGIVFADLNGLKEVNDESGHASGDTLLKNAARALRSAFEPDQIFRAGGDEFSIIVIDTSEEELLEKVETVKSAVEQYENLSFAIGSSFEKSSVNIRKALREADVRMYEDKRKYYDKFPGKRRPSAKDEFRYHIDSK